MLPMYFVDVYCIVNVYVNILHYISFVCFVSDLTTCVVVSVNIINCVASDFDVVGVVTISVVLLAAVDIICF